MKKIFNKSCLAVFAMLMALQFGMVSCSDDPGIENIYTSTKEYAFSYLEKYRDKNTNEAIFSDYVQILSRATGNGGDLRFPDLLNTYGSYTVFAPTNDAIKYYLNSKGYTSIDQLTKEECDTIALNSIIELACFTTDYSSDVYPKSNMLEHTMRIDTLTSMVDGEMKTCMYINKDARLIHADDSVCNGVVHTVNRVVCTINDLLPVVLSKDSTISLFYGALALTHVEDSLRKYIDESYGFATERDRLDSCSWTNNKLCVFTAAEYDNVAYTQRRYFNFTAFMVKDEVLQNTYGITKLTGKDDPSSLEYYAHSKYDVMYPEDKDITDYTDRRNALNRLISYHILDRYGDYYGLTAMDKHKLQNNFDRKHLDISDWYPTLMPNSLMKFSYPMIGTNPGLYINRRGKQSKADSKGVFVRGAYVERQLANNATPPNGIYYYIDKIVDYGQETQEVVLNERMRFDCSTLSPDFMTKGSDGDIARGHKTKQSDPYYGIQYRGSDAANNKNTCMGFKGGYVRRFKYTDNTHLHVRNRYLGFWSFEGDEVTIKGQFDVRIILPPVPAGTYEIRMFTCAAFASRGILQTYVDDIAQGIPFDMRPNGIALYGFKSDKDLSEDEDAILAFDKSIHNRGWMKGPGGYAPGDRASATAFTIHDTFRNLGAGQTLRRVIGTFVTDGKSEHVLRLQQKMESGGELNFDFIELCPSSVYNDPYFAEDIY